MRDTRLPSANLVLPVVAPLGSGTRTAVSYLAGERTVYLMAPVLLVARQRDEDMIKLPYRGQAVSVHQCSKLDPDAFDWVVIDSDALGRGPRLCQRVDKFCKGKNVVMVHVFDYHRSAVA